MLLCCGTICREVVPERTMLMVQVSAGFQSVLPLSTSKLGPSGADSQMGGLGPCGSLQRILL